MHGSNFVQWCFWYWNLLTIFFFFFCWETSLIITSSSGVAFDLPPTCTYTDASGINKTVMVQTLCYTCNDFFCIWGRWPSQLTLLDWIRNKISLQTSQLKKQGGIVNYASEMFKYPNGATFWQCGFQWLSWLGYASCWVLDIGKVCQRYPRHDELWNCNNRIARVF